MPYLTFAAVTGCIAPSSLFAKLRKKPHQVVSNYPSDLFFRAAFRWRVGASAPGVGAVLPSRSCALI
jgi:hypothetical protein